MRRINTLAIRLSFICAVITASAVSLTGCTASATAPSSIETLAPLAPTATTGTRMSTDDYPCSKVFLASGVDSSYVNDAVLYCHSVQKELQSVAGVDGKVKHLVNEYCGRAAYPDNLFVLDSIYGSLFGYEMDYGYGNFGWHQFPDNSHSVSFLQPQYGFPRPSLVKLAKPVCGDVLKFQEGLS